MIDKEIYSIREWAPLTNIIEQVPEKTLKGFFQTNVNITSVDACGDFIALGSDVGIVFWYNRLTNELQKLKTETPTRITCVKIVDSVEFIVAAGNSSGQVNVFQIPKELPPDLDLVGPCTKQKPIERYIIRGLHQSRVTCCEWSKNGMKLYSGDAEGVVVLTEFEYGVHLSKSVEIFRESFEIVQLSVYKLHLLVNTLFRSVVCRRDSQSGKWQQTKVGKKDRKQLMDCGGCFLKSSTSQQPKVICGRPGLRFWIADIDGNVERTLLFREAVARSPTWTIPILNPKFANTFATRTHRTNLEHNPSPVTDNFHNLYLYNDSDSVVVTHDGSTLYILNLERLSVEAIASGFRNILDFCVLRNEIFVLEGNRSLMRLAPMPEKPNQTARIIFNPAMPPPVPSLVQCKTIESPTAIEPKTDSFPNAEECLELPPIEQLNLNVPIELAVESPRAEQIRRLELFKRISELEFDESILHHSDKRKSHSHKKSRNPAHSVTRGTNGIVEIGHMAVGYCNEPVRSEDVLDAAFRKDNPSEIVRKINVPTEVPFQGNVGKDVINDLNCATKSTVSPLKFSFESLSQAYPKQLNVEDAGVQTTAHNTYSGSPDSKWGEYSSGQPIDDRCLRVTRSTYDILRSKHYSCGQSITPEQDQGEIQSFLLDFRRAQNPLSKPYSSPPPDESITSSEWEFLDN